jgi:hypothetical protein
MAMTRASSSRLASAGNLGERRHHHVALDDADQHAVLAAHQRIDRRGAEARGEHAIGRAGDAAAHHVPEARDAQVEADRLAVRAVVLHQLVHAALRALGDHRERVRLAAPVRVAQALGHVRRRELVLGQRDHLGAAGDAGHERDVAAVAAHGLDRERALVR